MARAFCPICEDEVEIGPQGRDDRGHEVAGVEPEPWVADVDARDADATAPATSTGGQGADDIDFGSLEAAVAELGLTSDDSDDDAFAAFEDVDDPAVDPPAADATSATAPAAPAPEEPASEDVLDALAAFEDRSDETTDDLPEPTSDTVEPAVETAQEPAARDEGEEDGPSEEAPGEIDTATFTARPKGKSRGGFFRRG